MTIELDDYERDNLLALLHLVYGGLGYGKTESGAGALSQLGTGDWVGQIYWKLAEQGFDPSVHKPNVSPQEQIDNFRRWWKP